MSASSLNSQQTANNIKLKIVSASSSLWGKWLPYRFDVALESFRNSLSMLGIFLSDDGQVADLIAVVLRQVAQQSAKSSETAAEALPEIEPLGEREDMTSRQRLHKASKCYLTRTVSVERGRCLYMIPCR